MQCVEDVRIVDGAGTEEGTGLCVFLPFPLLLSVTASDVDSMLLLLWSPASH